MQGSTFALLVGLTLTSPVAAAPAMQGNGEVIVRGRPSLGDNQTAVPYADLALTRVAGQRMLLQRVSFAIDSLCEGRHVTAPVDALKCNNAAWADVRPQLDRLLDPR